MKQVHKPIEITKFNDLKGRLAKAEQMVIANNKSADILYEQTGQIIPRYNLEDVKRRITKEYNKYYGYTNKYRAV